MFQWRKALRRGYGQKQEMIKLKKDAFMDSLLILYLYISRKLGFYCLIVSDMMNEQTHSVLARVLRISNRKDETSHSSGVSEFTFVWMIL